MFVDLQRSQVVRHRLIIESVTHHHLVFALVQLLEVGSSVLIVSNDPSPGAEAQIVGGNFRHLWIDL